MEILLYILSGAVVGLAIGMTGVGGGSLMTPLLILFGFPYNVAIGTDLLYAAITKSGGVYAHRKQKSIHWKIVFWLAAGSIPASLSTAYFLKYVFDEANSYQNIMTTSLGVMLIMTSLVLLFKKAINKQAHDETIQVVHWSHVYATPITFAMGIILGVFVTLSSVGAGAIGTAILLMLYPRLPALHIVGTDLAHAVPLTFIAGMGHLIFLGNVDFSLLACLLVGSLPAIALGTRIATKLPNNFLQPILATLLMGLGVKFAFF